MKKNQKKSIKAGGKHSHFCIDSLVKANNECIKPTNILKNELNILFFSKKVIERWEMQHKVVLITQAEF